MSSIRSMSRAHAQQSFRNDKPGSYYNRYRNADLKWLRKARRLFRHLQGLKDQNVDKCAQEALRRIERDHVGVYVKIRKEFNKN